MFVRVPSICDAMSGIEHEHFSKVVHPASNLTIAEALLGIQFEIVVKIGALVHQ